MSSQTGLSGLNAASRNLDVIGNNIANANTTGMKSSRSEFADLIASATGENGTVQAGIGTRVAAVSQLFTQGNLNITGRDLDVAINGGGFFQLMMPDGTKAYTRDGTFKLDTQGNVVTNAGANVLGYPTDAAGVPTSTIIEALKLPTNSAIKAKQTTALTAQANLDARAPLAAGSPAVVGPPAVAAILPTPKTTYGTSMVAYDGQGVPVPVSLFFSKIAPTTAGTDQWAVYDSTNAAAAPVGSLVFDATGSLTKSFDAAGVATTTPMTLSLTLTPTTPSIVPAFPVTLDLQKVTQFGTDFAVTSLSQDGYPPGELTSLKISEGGAVTARYSNGQTQVSGKLALADFRNVQGLAPAGGTNWSETLASGQAIQGSAGQGKFGKLTPGALEESNVDLTAELVSMMTAQRAYQANAQTIKTQDQMMQTIVNIR